MPIAKTAEVVWYVTGRFYATPAREGRAGKLLDVGYFLHLQGLPALFDGKEISESTAHLTFAAEPFESPEIDNGGLSIGIDLKGVFSIYLREIAGATFDDPASFAKGDCIATFARVSMVPTTKIASATATVMSNVFTARLVTAKPFVLAGGEYDFREIVGDGVTQWGVAATETLQPPHGYDAVVPFAGSAIRIG